MSGADFPEFVRALPEADLPFAGLRGWLLSGEAGQLLFNEADIGVTVPEHAHGDQWGVVIAGRIELTIDAETRTYQPGETYFIPAGTRHQARIFPGFRAVDFFADKERYRVRPTGRPDRQAVHE